MKEEIGAFVIFAYMLVWIYFALTYEDQEENKAIVWGITFFWPLIILFKLLNR